MEIAAFCTGFVSLVEAAKREEYVKALQKTIGTAKRLGCKRIISQTGAELSIDRKEQHESLVEGLKACVPYLEESGITLVVEPSFPVIILPDQGMICFANASPFSTSSSGKYSNPI